jgi:hypothetical protein
VEDINGISLRLILVCRAVINHQSPITNHFGHIYYNITGAMPGHVERGFMCRRWLCLAAATHERGEE